MTKLAPTETHGYEVLKKLLKEANYDGALALVDNWDVRSAFQTLDDFNRLRLRCMISDVLDYGARYNKAANVLNDPNGHIGKDARERLCTVQNIGDVEDLPLAKQQCWALILWGMTYYRRSGFEDALNQFELARRIAAFLHEDSRISSIGTLARAWYCIGLVHRERRETSQARAAFGEAIALAERGIADRRTRSESTASFDFNMARCAGLGVGWIAYNEARLTEATTMLALARRMMHGAKAKLVAAYLDTLQATIMMSKSAEATCIREALSLLRGAYSTLTSEGSCRHIHYALRCRNEIALAYLRLARTFTVDQAQREENLIKAERAVAAVKASATKLPKTEHKTYCVALITEARIRRERGEHAEAIARAKEAKTFGANLDAVQVDALISIGEAELGRRKYGNAVSAFLDALKKSKDHRKDAAVCYVHLCRAYLLDGQPGKAKEMFDRWESIGAGLENAFITNLAATDEQMLSKVLEDFLRTKDDIKHLGKAALHLKALRHWLAVTALALESDNFKLASERLGIGVGTLDVWLKLKVTDL